MYNFISKYEKKFESLKDRFSNEEITLIFAEIEADKLNEEVECALSIIPSLNQEDELTKRLLALYTQLTEFKQFLEDMIEMKRNQTL